MAIDITGHALLDEAGGRLPPPVLAEYSALAEDLLGVADLTWDPSDPELERARRAVALQVNFLIEQGTDAAVYASESRGARSVTYRMLKIHPVAAVLAARILGADAWASLTSKRG